MRLGEFSEAREIGDGMTEVEKLALAACRAMRMAHFRWTADKSKPLDWHMRNEGVPEFVKMALEKAKTA